MLCSKMINNVHLACSEAFAVPLKNGRPRNLLTTRFDASLPLHKKERLPLTRLCQNIGNSRCPTVWADLVSVCYTSSENWRTHGPGYEKPSAVQSAISTKTNYYYAYSSLALPILWYILSIDSL